MSVQATGSRSRTGETAETVPRPANISIGDAMATTEDGDLNSSSKDGTVRCMDQAELTRALFARWPLSFEEMCDSLRANFAAGCLWDQRPLARTRGPEQAVRFLRLARRGLGLETAEVEMLSLATGPVGRVHTERVDHLRRLDGTFIVSVPVAGVMQWRNDKIVYWREYFDAASITGQALPRMLMRGLARGSTTLLTTVRADAILARTATRDTPRDERPADASGIALRHIREGSSRSGNRTGDHQSGPAPGR